MNWIKEKSVTIPKYIYNVKFSSKVFNIIEVGEKTVTFSGKIVSSTIQKNYEVEIMCGLNFYPKVYIKNIDFSKKRPPHLYKDNSLCLYYLDYNEYKHKDLIFPKIYDWIILWIYYYELWLAYGEWLGGGISHEEAKEEENNV